MEIPKVENRIYLVRGHRVMLDEDLASLYEIPTKRLNEQVKRNIERFPADFMLRLTEQEALLLRSQFATSKRGSGGRRYQVAAFTEQGVTMLSSVLKSPRAIQANIRIMRTFVRLRAVVLSNAAMAEKIAALERKFDGQFQVVFEALRQLMVPVETKKRRIGFTAKH